MKSFALSIALVLPLTALAGPVGEAAIRAAAAASFPEYLELLALPNLPVKASDMAANADWLEKAFQRRGFQARQLPNKSVPLVFAEYGKHDPRKKTILFYMHYDGQPVVPTQWAQADPFKPVVKQRGADGKWSEVDRALLLRADFDPELRVFARAAADDKAPIMMFLAAFDLLRAQKRAPAVNVKVLIDSEEELNSPGISSVVASNLALLKADALVIHDGPSHASGRPTITFGNRGSVPLTLTLYGPKSPLHSGHYGNYVPNPAMQMARLLASMKDDEGRVTIPGYYAKSRLGAEDLKVVAESNDDEAAMRKRVGVRDTEKVGATYMEALQQPSLNIRGLAAAGVGDKAANIIPKEAVAEIDLRTTVETDAAYLLSLVRAHIEQQGYHLVEHEPTDAERAQYGKLLRFAAGQPAAAARQPVDSAVGRWAAAAMTAAHAGAGEKGTPVRIRMMGGTVPTSEIVIPLQMPFVLIPVVNSDNNQHAYDENMRMGHYLSGMRTMLGLLEQSF